MQKSISCFSETNWSRAWNKKYMGLVPAVNPLNPGISVDDYNYIWCIIVHVLILSSHEVNGCDRQYSVISKLAIYVDIIGDITRSIRTKICQSYQTLFIITEYFNSKNEIFNMYIACHKLLSCISSSHWLLLLEPNNLW